MNDKLAVITQLIADENTVKTEIKHCPACNSTNMLAKTTYIEGMKKAGLEVSEKDVIPPIGEITITPIVIPLEVIKQGIGGIVPVVAILNDVCVNCGTGFARDIYCGSQMVTPMMTPA